MVLGVLTSQGIRIFMYARSFHILLVEDSPSDVWLIKEALRLAEIPVRVTVVRDGVEAIEYLGQVQNTIDSPDLIVLDLNLPRKNGQQVLGEIKSSPYLRRIPVIVLSSSTAEDDRRSVYELNACCFVTKPSSLPEYVEMARGMDKFWLSGLEIRQLAL
jgi:CheY-like chemotaxis protein